MWKKVFFLGCLLTILPFSVFASEVKYAYANAPIQESNTSPRIIDFMPSGAEVEVLATEGDFYKIRHKNTIGYTSKRNVRDTMEYDGGSWECKFPPNGTFLQYAGLIKEFIINNSYRYPEDDEVKYLRVPLENCLPEHKVVDCSTYVCDVLYWYGYHNGPKDLCKAGRFYTGVFQGIADALSAGQLYQPEGIPVELTQFFERVSEDHLQPGDIIVNHKAPNQPDHAEIYAGNDQAYACGRVSQYIQERWNKPGTCILRVKSKK